jgi:predicted transposase YdaD
MELVAWLSGEVPLSVAVEPAELVETHVRRPDQIFCATLPPSEAGGEPRRRYSHVELQTRGDEEMDLRVAEYLVLGTRYFSRIEKRRVTLSCVVIYLCRQQYRPDPGEFRTDDGEGTSGLIRYRVVKLWEQDPSVVLGLPTPGLAPFAPLMKTDDPVRTVVESKEKILGSEGPALGRERKRELCGALFALSGLVIPDRDLLFKLISEGWMNLEESVTVQWMMERGEEKGLKKGREQGLAKGLLEAHRDDVIAVLESRFGAVDEGLRSRMEDLQDAEELRKLHRTALSAPSLEAFLEALA